MLNIAVYCGSRSGNNENFSKGAFALGEAIAKEGAKVVYGGASIGLMGAVADGALAQQGKVIGVLPKQLADREIAHSQLSELHFTASMHERKALMAELAHAFVVLPGGVGTLDEFFEVFTWAHINLHHKPVMLFNIDGFYDALLLHIATMAEAGFLREDYHELFTVITTINEFVDIIRAI